MTSHVKGPIPPPPLPPGTTTVVVPMRDVYVAMGVLATVSLALALLLHPRLWGRHPARHVDAFLLLLLLALVAHEGLHGLAMLACGVSWRDVRFGILPARGMVFAHTSTPLPVRRFALVAALPLVVLGIAPLAAGVALGLPLATWLGAIMTIVAAGDVAILWTLRRVPRGARVIDHESEPGFHVLPG